MPPFFGIFLYIPRSGLGGYCRCGGFCSPASTLARLFQWLPLMRHICRPRPRGRGQSWRYPHESRIRGGDIYATYFRHLPTQWIVVGIADVGGFVPMPLPLKGFSSGSR